MFWIKNSAADWIEYYWHLCYNLLSPKFVILKQSLQREQIICICADICTFPDLHYRHEQTSAPFDKVSIWSKERAERTVPSLGGHCKQANSAIFCSPLWPQTFMQTLRILCRYCDYFCTKKCSVEPLIPISDWCNMRFLKNRLTCVFFLCMVISKPFFSINWHCFVYTQGGGMTCWRCCRQPAFSSRGPRWCSSWFRPYWGCAHAWSGWCPLVWSSFSSILSLVCP